MAATHTQPLSRLNDHSTVELPEAASSMNAGSVEPILPICLFNCQNVQNLNINDVLGLNVHCAFASLFSFNVCAALQLQVTIKDLQDRCSLNPELQTLESLAATGNLCGAIIGTNCCETLL